MNRKFGFINQRSSGLTSNRTLEKLRKIILSFLEIYQANFQKYIENTLKITQNRRNLRRHKFFLNIFHTKPDSGNFFPQTIEPKKLFMNEKLNRMARYHKS